MLYFCQEVTAMAIAEKMIENEAERTLDYEKDCVWSSKTFAKNRQFFSV
jgi:hypothetical protein